MRLSYKRTSCSWLKEWTSASNGFKITYVYFMILPRLAWVDLRRQRHFAEAEIYLLRFQHCMTRAMTLIKMYVVGALKALTADIQRRMAEKVRIVQLLGFEPCLTPS
jgi:hypothetical protein